MSKQQTITINGVLYDARTGMRLDSSPVTTAPLVRQRGAAAPHIHSKVQHSKTLNRSFVTAPAAKPTPSVSLAKQPARRPQVARSPQISKFAPKAAPVATIAPRGRVMNDIGPVKHPLTVKTAPKLQRSAAPTHHVTPPAPKPAHEIKQQAIHTALQNAKPVKKTKRPSFFTRHPRMFSIASASLAVILLAGYMSYINMPNLSVRLAAAQAGINASYPSYQPSGYSLHGPVAYASGQVSMEFAANAGPQQFTLRETESNWDSSAVLTNYVDPQSNGDYSTYSDGGLTIYTYGNNAAWVNGGILYTIDGNAPLSNEQIRRIATSM